MGVMNYNYLGNFEVVFDFYEKVFEICKRFGCWKEEVIFYNNIGGVYEVCGDFKKVFEYYEKGFKFSVDIEDRVLEVVNLYFIGKVLMKFG